MVLSYDLERHDLERKCSLLEIDIIIVRVSVNMGVVDGSDFKNNLNLPFLSKNAKNV